MSLRRKFVAYLLFIHLIFAAVVIYLLWDHRIWLLAVEVFFLLSFIMALKIFQGLFQPLELITSGVEFMRDGDFTTRLRELGQPEMDTLIGIYNRMVDHLRAERVRMQEQHYFLEKILSVSPSAIVTLDYDEKVSFANPAAESVLQHPLNELKGKRLGDLAPPFTKTMDELAIGHSIIIPLRGIRKLRCYKSHFLDQGHPRTFYIIEELTEELRQTERAAYEKLIRMLSHEVNNSLGAANSLLHSCLHYKDQIRTEDRVDFETALTVAIVRTEHLNSFMKSFADIVKLPLPRRQFTDARTLLQNLVSLLSTELTRRMIRVVWDVQTEMEPVQMDEQQMEQVFLNVFKNAMEAIDIDGAITIRLGKLNRKNFVSIEDTGCGINEETRRHLFTPFFSTKENGQGIGLTLIQEILSQHKFEFSLESTPLQPTRFTILFC
ncbi:MAG: HAMP domain-containing protein [Ignavibacteria bacterium]|nr:HAMP domain-containing protein [Ignavibacteria bacterium]